MELQKGILYGPLQSRRLGLSLGINLLPDSFKLCSLNCCYCQYGWTHQTYETGVKFSEEMPSVLEVEAAIEGVFDRAIEFDFLTLCGNGEPTLHPNFEEIVDLIWMIRKKGKKDFKIAVISNSSTCFLPNIQSALSKVDLAIMKLDAGNAPMFMKLNGNPNADLFNSILTGLKGLDKYLIQTMFVEGAINNSRDSEVASWLEKLKGLRPAGIQVYSLARDAASDKILQVGKKRLEEIAELGRLNTSFEFEVF